MLFLASIRTLSRLTDEYVRIEDTSGNKIVVYADSGNIFIPTCVDVSIIHILTDNYTNCFEDLPVLFEYLNKNLTAFLTTDMILRPTSRRMDCKEIKSRYFFFPNSSILLHQMGSSLTKMARDDVLWQALDTSNILLSQANAIKHYHGTLDGLDLLSMQEEYIQYDEMGVRFTALDKGPDIIAPQTWWSEHKWYFYGVIIGIVSLVCCCGFTWLCTCADCCLMKFFCVPCMAIHKRQKNLRLNRRISTAINAIPTNEINPLTRAIVMHTISPTPTITKSIQPTAPPNYSLNYIPVEDSTELTLLQKDVTIRRSTESQRRKNKERRSKYKHRDDVSLPGGM